MWFLGRKSIVISLLTLFVLFSFTTPALAQDDTAQVGVFEEVEVAPGELVQVPISVRNVQDLYGLDILLEFDPALVQVEDADPSLSGIQAALGEFLDPGLLLFNTADNTSGTYHFVMSQYNPSEPKSGEGVVLVLTIKGIAEGVSPLKVADLKLASNEGIEIPSSPVDSSLTVRAGAPTLAATIPVVDPTALIVLNTFTPVPTETPVPTVTPTAVIEPTRLPAGGEATVDTPPEDAAAGSDAPGFWLVNNWWIVLILLVAVIAAGLYLFVWKKKTH